MQLVFRADASSAIGAGHVMRCLTLADALRVAGASCTFICRSLPGNMGTAITERGFALRMLPPSGIGVDSIWPSDPPHAAWLGTSIDQDAADTLKTMGEQRWDWLVVDHYALDARWERALRGQCRQLLVLDDLADRSHDCDLLVDPGIESSLSERYARLLPREAMVFLGPRYAILRPEFDAARSALPTERGRCIPRHLLVMFGGNDAEGHTIEAMRAIHAVAPPGIGVDVVVSAINQDQVRLAAWCREHLAFVLHVATDQVSVLMARADLVVASGGGATWERLYLRRPALLKPVAENQRKPLEYMASAGLFTLYVDQQALEHALRGAFAEGVEPPPDVVRNGVSAICAVMLDQLVSLGHPAPLDLRRTFGWLQDEGLRRQFLMRGGAPQRRPHFSYWRKLLVNDAERIFSIRQGKRHIGNAGIRNIDHQTGIAELWLYLGEAGERGTGIGRIVLRLLEESIRDGLGCHTAVLHVSRTNLPAYKLYCKNGYRLSAWQDGTEVGFQPGMDVVRMEKSL